MKLGLSKSLVMLVALLWSLGAWSEESISDAEMALGYYQPLAEQGEPYAQLTIGEMYMEGAGVEQDLLHAYAWFAVAAHQGVEEAAVIMEHVLGQLNEDEQRQAKVIADQFIQHFSMQ